MFYKTLVGNGSLEKEDGLEEVQWASFLAEPTVNLSSIKAGSHHQ